MPDVTHLSPQQQRIFAAISDVIAGYDSSYGVEAPQVDSLRAILKELAEPTTCDLVHEVGAGSNSFPVTRFPS